MESMIMHVIYECSDGNLRGNCVCLKSKIQYSKCTNVFLIDHHDCDVICLYFWCIYGYRKITSISRDLKNKTIDLPLLNFRLMFTSRLTFSFRLRVTWRIIGWRCIHCHPLWMHYETFNLSLGCSRLCYKLFHHSYASAVF